MLDCHIVMGMLSVGWGLTVALLPDRRSIAQAGAIPTLLDMAQGDSPAEAAAAAGALWNLAANARNQEAIQAAGGVPIMVALFQERGNPGAQMAAAGALCNLLLRRDCHADVLAAGGAPAMVEVLECGPPGCRPTVARALFVLAREEAGCRALVAAGACQPLAVEVRHPSPPFRACAFSDGCIFCIQEAYMLVPSGSDIQVSDT